MEVNKSKKYNILFFVILSTVLIFIDQITKYYAAKTLMDKPSYILIKDVLQLTYLENRGAAWGMFQGAGIIFIIIGILWSIFVVYASVKIRFNKRFLILHFVIVLIFSGAIGNLIDRIFFGYVRDFIYFYGIDFPIFNFADVCVSVAVILFAIAIIFIYKKEDYKELKKMFK